MTYRILPYFERGIEVSPLEAKQDRISIEIGDWIFIGDDVDLSIILMELHRRTYPLTDGSAQTFLTARQGPLHNCHMSFRSQAAMVQGAPLLGGRLICRRTRGDDHGSSTYRLFFRLVLNPTRSLNHQPLHAQIRRGAPVTAYPQNDLRRRNPPTRTADEIVLDGGDNVILDRRINAMSAPQYWRHFRNEYLEAVPRFLDDLIWRAYRETATGGYLRRDPRFNLKEIETYWEFRADDPIQLMRNMEPHFISLGRTTSIRRYENLASQTELSSHSAVLRSEFVEGVIAKVYAKTTRRIRVELTRDLTSARLPALGHTSTTLSEIVSLIDQVAQLEAVEAQMLLSTIERAIPADISQIPPYELVRRILSASADQHIQATLLSMLINNNGISLVGSASVYSEPVDALVRIGVLERGRRGSRFFRLAERYQQARSTLLSAQASS